MSVCAFRTARQWRGERGREKAAAWRAHQVPSLIFDRFRLTLHDEGPHEIWDRRRRLQPKVQRDVVSGSVEQVDESPCRLVDDLKKIVAWSEREDGVQRRDVASAGREVEEIGVSVSGQVTRGGTRELLVEDGHVRSQPASVQICILGNDVSRDVRYSVKVQRTREVRRDEPALGLGLIGPTSKPEEHAVKDEGHEREDLIFEDFNSKDFTGTALICDA
jgi:hypothetical protein